MLFCLPLNFQDVWHQSNEWSHSWKELLFVFDESKKFHSWLHYFTTGRRVRIQDRTKSFERKKALITWRYIPFPQQRSLVFFTLQLPCNMTKIIQPRYTAGNACVKFTLKPVRACDATLKSSLSKSPVNTSLINTPGPEIKDLFVCHVFDHFMNYVTCSCYVQW